MKSEGLKPSQLAELLGVNPAGISHILAGRNKPGFDLLQKILRRFPQINPDWLLLDSQQMYRAETEKVTGCKRRTHARRRIRSGTRNPGSGQRIIRRTICGIGNAGLTEQCRPAA